MAIQIYVGPTGCGKTYQAFNRLNRKSRAMYLAPCRQLVYESAMKYGNSRCHVSTSDLKVGDGKNFSISFRTYEACREEDLVNVDTLIIDEAHFINDSERGSHLMNLIYYMERKGKKIILLSATLTFHVEGAKIIRLAPRGQNFEKEEISLEDALARAKDGVPTLIFHKRRDDCGKIAAKLGMSKRCGIITANTSVADRIKLVELFNKGSLTILEATNAMAQGVNVPCENLINFDNGYDDFAVIIQKFGRLGRTGVTKEGAKLTYCFAENCEDSYGESDAYILSTAKEGIKINRSRNKIRIKTYREEKIKDFDLRTPGTEKEIAVTKRRIEKAWSRL